MAGFQTACASVAPKAQPPARLLLPREGGRRQADQPPAAVQQRAARAPRVDGRIRLPPRVLQHVSDSSCSFKRAAEPAHLLQLLTTN